MMPRFKEHVRKRFMDLQRQLRIDYGIDSEVAYGKTPDAPDAPWLAMSMNDIDTLLGLAEDGVTHRSENPDPL